MPARFLQTLHNLQYTLPTKTTTRHKMDTPTIPEKIHYYTQMLTDSNCSTSGILHAFSRLNELDAPIRIFEQAGVENVLKELYSDDRQVVFAYEVNKLNQKLNKLRKKNVQKPMSSWEEKMEVDNEEEEYDPEYPEIRSSMEMAKYKLPLTSNLLLEYEVYIPTPIRPASIDGFSSSSSSSGASSPSSDGEVEFIDSD